MNLFKKIKELVVDQFLRFGERAQIRVRQSDGSEVTVTMAELQALATAESKLGTEAGAGITGGTGTVYASSVRKVGGIIYTSILIDLTGLASSTTDLDIIGQGASAAHLVRIECATGQTVTV